MTAIDIAVVVCDYGGTLTTPEDPVDLVSGCRPVESTAAATLRLLHQRHLRLMLGSNNSATQNRRLALRRAGVEHLFTDVLTSEELGYGKPDPRFYAAVLNAAACPPEQVLFVGNNYRTDVAAPISHGMRAVLIRPHGRLIDGEELPIDHAQVISFPRLPAFLGERHAR
ncbi:HAD family hydrolase [Spongiactinospora gelatinilytica]|nr:HAD family hydrolase [Spongiactinospora gelatinilytica]